MGRPTEGPWVDLSPSSLTPTACQLLEALTLVHRKPFLLSSIPSCPPIVPLPKGQRILCSQLRAELNLGVQNCHPKQMGERLLENKVQMTFTLDPPHQGSSQREQGWDKTGLFACGGSCFQGRPFLNGLRRPLAFTLMR